VTVVARTFAERWHLWSRRPLIRREPTLSLPSDDAEQEGVRAWLALEELARAEHAAGNPGVAHALAQAREADRDEIRDKVATDSGRPLPHEVAASICALAAGLRAELVEPMPSLSHEEAGRILRGFVAAAQAAN
jgi:hypothetical protein